MFCQHTNVGSENRYLKRQCHKIFTEKKFGLKDSTWTPYEQAKMVSRTFSFSQRYSCKTCVHVVNNYADTMSSWSTTTLAWCQRSQQLCGRQNSQQLHGHCISIVNNYPDTCQRSQRLPRHWVSIFNNYADTQKVILRRKK